MRSVSAWQQIREQTAQPFNVNLFVIDAAAPSAAELDAAMALLNPIRAELGLPPATAPASIARITDEQLETVLALKVPLVSATFGLMDAASIERLHAAGSRVIGVATNVAEALAWQHNGADFICAQGAEAGGHRGTFIGRAEDSMIGTMALVPQVVDAVSAAGDCRRRHDGWARHCCRLGAGCAGGAAGNRVSIVRRSRHPPSLEGIAAQRQ